MIIRIILAIAMMMTNNDDKDNFGNNDDDHQIRPKPSSLFGDFEAASSNLPRSSKLFKIQEVI